MEAGIYLRHGTDLRSRMLGWRTFVEVLNAAHAADFAARFHVARGMFPHREP